MQTGTKSQETRLSAKLTNLTENKFSKEGYNFIGWSTTPNGAVEYIDGQNILNETTENGKVIKLYAVWQKKIFKITLNDDIESFLNEGTTIALYGEYGTLTAAFCVDQLVANEMAQGGMPVGGDTFYLFQVMSA